MNDLKKYHKKITKLLPFLFGLLLSLNMNAQMMYPNVRVNDLTNQGAQMDTSKALAVVNNTIYTVWSDERNGNPNLFFAKSINGGQTFLPAVSVAPTFSADSHVFASIYVDINGIIYVSWTHVTNGLDDWNIWFTKSTDAGLTFLPVTEVTTTSGFAFPSLKTYGNHVYIFYVSAQNYPAADYFFARSIDQGVTFETPIQINTAPCIGTIGYEGLTSMDVDSAGNIYLAWVDGRRLSGQGDIYFAKSTDAGLTFGSNIMVNDINSTGVNAVQYYPKVKVGSNNEIFVAFTDKRLDIANGSWESNRVYITKSLNGGTSFQTESLLANHNNTCKRFDIAISQNKLAAVLSTHVGGLGWAAWYFESTNAGVSFADPEPFSDNFFTVIDIGEPFISLNSVGDAYAVWLDNREGDLNIYFSKRMHSDVMDRKIVGYEYAFNNGDGLQFTSVSPTQNFNLNVNIDVSSLTNALNVFHVRFKDDSGLWSSIKSSLFMTQFSDAPSTKQIVGYEYAFNNQQGLQYVPITPATDFNLLTDINVSALTNALNVLHIRFKDNTGKWSSMKSHLFMTQFSDASSTKQIVGYEYAFNNQQGLQYVPITPATDFNLLTDINVSALTNALNVLHIRFKDNTGKWSSMKSHLFMTQFSDASSTKQIVGYEYAFNNQQGLQYVPVTPETDFNLLTDIDVSALTNALNVLHIRFKDNTGKWSSMKSHLFMTQFSDVPSTKQIVGYEYAFNNGQSFQYMPVTPATDFNLLTDIDVSALSNAINVLQIRFKDNTGKWSSMKSHLFAKTYLGEETPNNKISQYFYWFDNDISTMQVLDVNPVNPLVLTELNMDFLWEGDHEIHTQYKDINGKYSVITSNLVHKNPYPVAAFNTDETAICLGDAVSFTDAGSIDYNTIVYDFGDGQTATDLNTSHIYAATGSYTVTLTVTHTVSGLTDVETKTIQVSNYPINTITSSEPTFPACFGTSVDLTADAIGANYEWSTGATTRTITVNTAGTYSVEVSNPANTNCSVVSNDVVVTYKPEIANTVTLQNWPLLLSADEAVATYQWVDCTNGNVPISGATLQTYEPTVNGEYAVQITKNGCTVTSACTMVGTVNVADFGIKELVKMYPNPANEFVNIANDIPIRMVIYNVNGVKILEQEFEKGKQTLDISYFSSGLYLTKITALSGEWENSYGLFRLIRE